MTLDSVLGRQAACSFTMLSQPFERRHAISGFESGWEVMRSAACEQQDFQVYITNETAMVKSFTT